MRINAAAGQNKPVTFADIRRCADKTIEHLESEKPNQAVVDLFDDQQRPDMAAYKVYKGIQSLESRVADENQPVLDLAKEMGQTIVSRRKLTAYTAMAAGVTLCGVVAAGVIHATGLADLGTVGATLAEAVPYVSPLIGAMAPAVSVVANSSTEGLRKDLDLLVNLNRIERAERAAQTQVNQVA